MTTLEIALYLLGAANIAGYAKQKGVSAFLPALFWPVLTLIAVAFIVIAYPFAWYKEYSR